MGLEMPESPVRHDSPSYIHPAEESRCFEEIEKPGALIRSNRRRAWANQA